MRGKRVLFLGLGDLGSQVLDVFVRVPGNHTFLVGGRNLEKVRQRSNVSLFAAMQLGLYPDVSCISLDLWNGDQMAEIISHFQPEIIFCAVTVQPWMVINTLPSPLFERLYPAMAGPWLPWSLVLVYKLMQAIQQTGLAIQVINASYPDAVNTILSKVDLAPTTGIGNLANNIPALKKSVAFKLNVPLEQVELRFVAQHYVSHKISRVGNAGGGPFHLTVYVDGKDLTHLLEREHLFDLLPTLFKRSGKGAGHLVTAASTANVFEGMANDTGTMTHAPGPNGLPGGYPIKVNAQGVEVVLPDDLSLEAAIQINEMGLSLDGIEKIDDDGTVSFAEQNMAILKETFGYECLRLPLSEVEDRAEELHARYRVFASKYQR